MTGRVKRDFEKNSYLYAAAYSSYYGVRSVMWALFCLTAVDSINVYYSDRNWIKYLMSEFLPGFTGRSNER